MAENREMQRRTELLLGTERLERIRSTRVLLFGVGGVGSWVAECLVRSGIGHITIVDNDCVSVSNCNRQLVATSKTVGRVKVEALRERLLEIDPYADVTALNMTYSAETAESFGMEDYDFVIDAIDSLAEKADLILRASALPKSVTFFSSMGAALRIDPFKVRKAKFWDVSGDPLARALRKRFKKQNTFPKRDFWCVYSEELPMENACDQSFVADELTAKKAQINGSLCHITATFGMAIAGMVLSKVVESSTGAEE